MKVLYILVSILIVFDSALGKDTFCYECDSKETCENEGKAEKCQQATLNCLVEAIRDKNVDIQKKSCFYGTKSGKNFTSQSLKEFLRKSPFHVQDTEYNGCVNIVNKKVEIDFCLCSGDNCNKNSLIPKIEEEDDKPTMKDDETPMECYTCGDILTNTPCKENEMETVKKCSAKVLNCFHVEFDKDETKHVYKGCIDSIRDKEETMYGCIDTKSDERKTKGDACFCHKNKCNLNRQSWPNSGSNLVVSAFVLSLSCISYMIFK